MWTSSKSGAGQSGEPSKSAALLEAIRQMRQEDGGREPPPTMFVHVNTGSVGIADAGGN